MTDVSVNISKKNRMYDLLKRIKKARYLYILILPGLIYYLVFHYFPIYGVTLAFKTYKANLGIVNSPFVGFLNYEFVFKDPYFFRALKNTFIISFFRIILQFPFAIILALMIDEIRTKHSKKFFQTIFTFPHFLSWVIVSGILINFLGEYGLVNSIIEALGGDRIGILSSQRLFRPLIYITEIWKSSGWGCIIYLAAISGIDREQYESAYIDGASRMQQMIYITIPGIKSTIMVMLILSVGNIMNAGFDQIFNLYNPAVQEVSDILDTYIYRITFEGPTDFSFSTAIGLFKSVINFTLLLSCDRFAKALNEQGLF